MFLCSLSKPHAVGPCPSNKVADPLPRSRGGRGLEGIGGGDCDFGGRCQKQIIERMGGVESFSV